MHHMNRSGPGLRNGAKRILDQVEGDNAQGLPSQRQRSPAVRSVGLEDVGMDRQDVLSALEPMFRKVVREELERAFLNGFLDRLISRISPGSIRESNERDFSLHFTNKLSFPLFTGRKVLGEGDVPLCVTIKNNFTNQVVTSGPLSSAKLELVVLDGDFTDEDEDWTDQDFDKYVVKERDRKRPLLAGDVNVTLKEGVGTLGELTFTDNSSWTRNKKFRLGVRIAPGLGEGRQIKESKTEAFQVKDQRGELYKKHYPPHLNDEVWRLENISRNGAFCDKLRQQKIFTVQDFLRLYVMDKHKLRTILGNGKINKTWDATIKHAQSYKSSGKRYFYPAGGVGLLFNDIYELLGVIFNSDVKTAESLNESEKVCVDKLVTVAYRNSSDIIEYENGPPFGEPSSRHPLGSFQIEGNVGTHELTGISSQSMSLPQQPGELQSMSTPTSILAASSVPASYGYGYGNALEYINEGNLMVQGNQVSNPSANPHGQSFLNTSFLVNGGPADTGVACGSSQSILSISIGGFTTPLSQPGFQVASVESQYPSQIPFNFYVSEEGIRAQNAVLPNDAEMQQQLQHPLHILLSENAQLGEDADSTVYARSPAYPQYGVCSSGVVCLGWSKLEVALRWGVFFRKIAERKAIQRAPREEIEV